MPIVIFPLANLWNVLFAVCLQKKIVSLWAWIVSMTKMVIYVWWDYTIWTWISISFLPEVQLWKPCEQPMSAFQLRCCGFPKKNDDDNCNRLDDIQTWINWLMNVGGGHRNFIHRSNSIYWSVFSNRKNINDICPFKNGRRVQIITKTNKKAMASILEQRLFVDRTESRIFTCSLW